MKGLFIPEITAEMFRNGCFESIESLMAEGEIYDIDYEPEQRWIPVISGKLPETSDPVNITWVNHRPESYYSNIKDKQFVDTGHYYNGRWWWHSSTCQDYLDEYGKSDFDYMDDAIEVVAWRLLPKPYREEEE